LEGLNEAHQNRILITLLDLRRQLERVEDAILQPAKLSPFFEHDNDLSADQAQRIRQVFTSLRVALLRAAEKLGISIAVRRSRLSWEVQCLLSHFQLSMAELSPKQLRGYGSVGEAASEALRQIQEDLAQLTNQLASQLSVSPSIGNQA
jgi:hypothetical protein